MKTLPSKLFEAKGAGLFVRAVRAAGLFAALVMLAGAAQAAVHDHEQRPDIDGACVVCAVAAVHAGKLAPSGPLVAAPDRTPAPYRLSAEPGIAPVRASTRPHPPRAPPLHAPRD